MIRNSLEMQPLTINLPDGHQTVVQLHSPIDKSQGLIIFIPALGVSVDYYKDFAKQLTNSGFTFAAIEMRGMRHSSLQDARRDNFGYKEILETDLSTVVPLLIERYPKLNVWLCGHSLGGQLALLHASSLIKNGYQSRVRGIVLIAGGSNHYQSLPSLLKRCKRYLGINAIRSVNAILGYFPGHILGFGGRQPKNLISDWTYEGLKGRYQIRNTEIDYNKLLESLSLPVLFISIEGDLLVPKSSAERLASKLPLAEVSKVELTSREYSNHVLDHFRWSKYPKPIVDITTNWLVDLKRQS